MRPGTVIEQPANVGDREDYMGEREHLSDMEKEIYVDNLIIEYVGYFSYKELLLIVDSWAKEKGYYREISKAKHWIAPSGRNSAITYRLHKKFKQLYVSTIDVTVSGIGMTDELKELDGRTTALNKGKAKIVFNAWLMSHLKGRWEARPKFAVLRRIVDKFIYKLDRYEYPGKVVNDTKDLANKLRGALLIYKHKLAEGEFKEVEGKPEAPKKPAEVPEKKPSGAKPGEPPKAPEQRTGGPVA